MMEMSACRALEKFRLSGKFIKFVLFTQSKQSGKNPYIMLIGKANFLR